MDTYDLVSKHPLLAILRNVPLEKTIDYAEAAVQGGAPFFEVALNSPHALEQITMLRTHFGDRCTVGAGTAITVERCKAALDAGAQFLLTPGTPLDVFSYCAENDIALLPGVLTPTDVATSLQFGYKTMKLFPAGCISVGLASSLMPKDAVAANDWEACAAYVRGMVDQIQR